MLSILESLKRFLGHGNSYYVTSVFKTNGVPEFTFVRRSKVDEGLNEVVSERNKLLLFLGYSKSGKTVYRKKFFQEHGFKQVVFRCNSSSSWQDLYHFICTEADLPIPASVTRTGTQSDTMRASGTVSGGPASATANAEHTETTSDHRSSNYPAFPIDANYICNNLHDEKTIIVIEDFHLVDRAFSDRLSEDLKHFLDEGILVLIIGIPASPGRALKNNPDLGGRTQRIVFDTLETAEIEELLDKGEERLNISIRAPVREQIALRSWHNAYLVQAISQQMLLKRHVRKTSPSKLEFTEKDEVDDACRALAAELASDYREVVTSITAGQRKQKADKAYNQYEEVLRAVRDFDINQLENGITYTDIGRHSWNEFPPEIVKQRIESGSYKSETVFKVALNNQISQALNRLADTFARANTRPVLLYSDDKLYLMDLAFKFYLQWHTGVISTLGKESA